MAVRKKKAPARKKRITKKKATTSEVPVKAAAPAKSGRGLAPWEDLDRLFDDFLQRRWPHPFRDIRWPELPSLREWKVPSVDVVDRDEEVFVRAEIPGIEKEDLDVSIVERILRIKGSTRHEEEKRDEDYYRQEIRSGSFSRTVLLPSEVNTAKAKASYKDGILELHLPKVVQAKREKISVV